MYALQWSYGKGFLESKYGRVQTQELGQYSQLSDRWTVVSAGLHFGGGRLSNTGKNKNFYSKKNTKLLLNVSYVQS